LGSRYDFIWSIGNDDPHVDVCLNEADLNANIALIGDPIYQSQDPRLCSEITEAGGESQGPRLARLPYSAEEIDRITQIIHPGMTSSLFTGCAATVQNAIRCLTDYDFAHFACHAMMEKEEQTLCLSCFTEDRESAKGAWTASEISQGRFNTKLVSLSACATGVGKVTLGEGPYSLGRAFLEAGVQRVIVTSWPISDEATSTLMQTFYGSAFGCQGTGDLAGALRTSRIAMINSKKWNHPYFWAGHRLIVPGISFQNAEVVPISVDSQTSGSDLN
jgi:CHAT domain-containing protein